MGLIRKLASASTLGGVKYTSKREAETKAAHAQARTATEEAKLAKAQRKASEPTLGKMIRDAAAKRDARKAAEPAQSATPALPDVAARLTTLTELRAQGLVTDEEFDTRRQVLLDEVTGP